MSPLAFCVDGVRSTALRALNYSPRVERIRSASKRKSVALDALLGTLGPAYGTVFTRIDCRPEHGVDLLSQSDMFAAEPQGRVIRRDSMAHPERHEIRPLEVLIAGAGTLGEHELYGRTIIADGRLTGKYVGPDSMSLRFAEPNADHSLFTYAFLASPTGVAAIRSTSYGTKILRFREDLLRSLPVPSGEDGAVRRVAALVRVCVQQREIYLDEILRARRVIEDVDDMREAHAMCFTRQARAVLWDGELPTLRGWTFASSGGALGQLKKKWSARLGDVLQPGGMFHGLLRQRTPCTPPAGIALYSQRDVFSIRRVPRRIAHPGCDDRALFVPPGSLLIASRGQLSEGALFGKVELGDTFPTRSAATQDILRVLPAASFLGVAYAFLASMVGQALLRSAAVGTSIPILRLDLVSDIPFPSPTTAVSKNLATIVQAAVRARLAADAAEAEAIRIIEEEVLPAWLS